MIRRIKKYKPRIKNYIRTKQREVKKEVVDHGDEEMLKKNQSVGTLRCFV